MPIYTVAYWSHEDSDIVYVSCDKEYTGAEFEEIAINAIVSFLKRVKAGDTKLPLRADHEWPFMWNASELFPTGIKLAMMEAGFDIIEPVASITLSGWQDLFWEDDCKWCGDDSPTQRLIDALKKEGFTKEDSGSYAHRKNREH